MIDVRLTSVGTRSATGGLVAVDREEEFQRVLTEFGPALARLSLGYELDPDNRRDLLQEIHIAVWRSLDIFDSLEDVKTDEIAEITGLSRGSVGVRIHRIKQLLLKMFDARGHDVRR